MNNSEELTELFESDSVDSKLASWIMPAEVSTKYAVNNGRPFLCAAQLPNSQVISCLHQSGYFGNRCLFLYRHFIV